MPSPITDLILATFQLNGRLIAAGDALVGDLALTSARWQVLGAIALYPADLSVAGIARNMGLSRQAVQRVVNDLAARGLVRFAPNPHHVRAQLVLLTAAGRAQFEEAQRRQTPWAASLADGIEPADIAACTALLQSLARRLDERPADKGD